MTADDSLRRNNFKYIFFIFQVTAIAFSTSTSFPPGCFGSTVAKATASNIEVLKKWILNLEAGGNFKMIINNISTELLPAKIPNSTWVFTLR